MQTKQFSRAWEGLLIATQTLMTKAKNRQPIRFPPDALRSINQLAQQRLGDEAFSSLGEHWEDGDKALALCKKGDLQTSGKMFDYAHRRLNDLTGEARQLAEVLFYPKVAYYYYRIGQFTAAEDSMARTLCLDDELQDIYHAFHGHKLHVLQNMSRMLAFQKRNDSAAGLVLDIMHYIISPQYQPYKTGDWGATYLGSHADIQPLPVTFEFVFLDFCRDCFRFPSFETATVNQSALFIEALKKVADQENVYRMALDWFQTKRSLYVYSSAPMYLRQSASFLSEYSERYDAFKLLLLMDAMRVAELLEQPTAKQSITSFINDYYKLKLVA